MIGTIAPIDLTIAVTTPENISFEYQLAGPFRRLPALLLDIVFRWMIVIVAALLAIFTGATTLLPGSTALMTVLFFIGIFLLSWFYGLTFEAWWNGQTPGKRIAGIRVVSVDGRPINGVQATIRNFVRIADFFPFASTLALGSEESVSLIPTFLVGLICIVSTRRFQRLGDLAAGTMVVVDEPSWFPTKIPPLDPRTESLAELIPANFRMTNTMAKTIALFVLRRASMSPRRREVTASRLAGPLIDRFGLRPDTSYDLLLCTLYRREFLTEKTSAEKG